jgi:excisionase family DNA binding protein
VIGSPWMMSVASRLGVSRHRTQIYSMLLSVEGAADVLRLGRTRTYELVMAKKIQCVKVGRRRLVVPKQPPRLRPGAPLGTRVRVTIGLWRAGPGRP